MTLDIDSLEGSLARKTWQLALKRLFDVCAATAGLAVLSPVLLVVAALVDLSSPGPILFRQPRVGYREKEFAMFKFRSMRVAEDARFALARQAAAARGILVKSSRDPRITPVGAVLRAASLDELPQLVNVLRGEMSIVGPRPLVRFMLTPCPDFSRARSLVRPGITGLWQVNDRENNTSAASMMPHDLQYVEQFSLGLDLRIL
jgi:exopolysaccharide production protein ExoY